jgi:hypothetical protein
MVKKGEATINGRKSNNFINAKSAATPHGRRGAFQISQTQNHKTDKNDSITILYAV